MAVDLNKLTGLRDELETFVGQLQSIVGILQGIPADLPATAEGLATFGVTLTIGEGLSEDDWTEARMVQASIAVRDIINAISDDWVIGAIQFMEAFGGTEIQLIDGPYTEEPSAAASTKMVDDRPSGTTPVIYLYTRPTGASSDFVHSPENIVHEFGHVLVFRHNDIYEEWQLLWILISEFDTDMGWSDGIDSLQNQSTLEDFYSGEISRLKLEHERVANMFEAWVYDRKPDVNANSEEVRQLRAAWVMWIFMYGGCPETVINTTLTLEEQPCGTGFLNWIEQFGDSYEE